MSNEPQDEDDDWIDLEKPGKAGVALPRAAVRIAKPAGRGDGAKLRASVVLRFDLAEWALGAATRFRVQIGGPDANMLRIVPDNEAGKFEVLNQRGSAGFRLGHVTAWPNEGRDPTEAVASFAGSALVLSLPRTFAKAGAVAAQKAPEPVELPKFIKPAAKPAPFPITTAAPGLAKIAPARRDMQPFEEDAAARLKRAGIVATREVVPVAGEPPPGRSALDQRKARP